MDFGSILICLMMVAYIAWEIKDSDRETILYAIVFLVIVVIMFWIFDLGFASWTSTR